MIRTKFILHKIFFRMSILLSSKTSWMFFNLWWKNCEKPFVGGCDHFEGKWASGYKNQYNLFCRKWGFKYFSFNNFLKKKTIFSKITEKNFLGYDHFSGNGTSDNKNNLFYWKLGTEYGFQIFSSKTPNTVWMNAKKPVLGAHFPPYR